MCVHVCVCMHMYECVNNLLRERCVHACVYNNIIVKALKLVDNYYN